MAKCKKEPSGLLAFDARSTQPGILKVLYMKDGVLTDPGWAVSFPQSNTSQKVSYPLRAGQYELIGFKPLAEASGKVSMPNLRIVSGTGVRNISEVNFVATNQLDKLSSQNGEVIIAPSQGA